MKEQTRQKQKAYRIEGDFYIVVDDYNYSVAKHKGKKEIRIKGESKGTYDNYDFLSFHPDIIKALESYCRIAQKEKALSEDVTAKQAGASDIKELMINLSAETKRLADTLKSLEKLITYQSDR